MYQATCIIQVSYCRNQIRHCGFVTVLDFCSSHAMCLSTFTHVYNASINKLFNSSHKYFVTQQFTQKIDLLDTYINTYVSLFLNRKRSKI
jgi:hypothetical protein